MPQGRTRRAVTAAVEAGRALGLRVERGTVLHDVFSVVVHLEPQPVVARIPVVLTASVLPERQAARQQRELDVVAWLDAQGVPVVPPSPLVPRYPVRRDGFPMTFWELADVADDHQAYHGVDVSYAAQLHAALARYPGELPFLAPFNDGLPDMLTELDGVEVLTAGDIDRARGEYEALRRILADAETFARTFPDASVQPIQGDGPSHNVIRTKSGIRFSDFEDVSRGPIEWDLAMLGTAAIDQYESTASQLALRAVDREVLRVMDYARRLQFVGCLTLIPQLPLLAQGLATALDEWRATPSFS
ncbi:phosphotransferase family protein [Mycobacterium sp. pW049]|uniref:phosphotransferase family protein n=1 Tax=[Mycobacterium] bulgaricum TaxID=3238985 RepID=UPI00351B4D5C